ncbi:MAG: hypothetical protein JWO04_575 [Gammaproteobacteria bacterium]|jgi:hypothetical protein|nr:hypothetical protein [Gammaproteobacteria bacterium]
MRPRLITLNDQFATDLNSFLPRSSNVLATVGGSAFNGDSYVKELWSADHGPRDGSYQLLRLQ